MDVIPVTVHVNVYNLTRMTISQTRSFQTLYIGVGGGGEEGGTYW